MAFLTGNVVVTAAVDAEARRDKNFAKFVNESFGRYIKCDWGDTSPGDAKDNDRSIKYGGTPIVARYVGNDSRVVVIKTEWNRSKTTIMFSLD